MEIAAQPSLFEKSVPSIPLEEVVLVALGEFQARGHVLADRELALDRLHRAFTRASQKFGVGELSDELVVKVLRELGASVTELPNFVAKRPFRVVINDALSRRATEKWKASGYEK